MADEAPATDSTKIVYPSLKNLFLDEDCESFQYYMPASLVLCKKVARVRSCLIMRVTFSVTST